MGFSYGFRPGRSAHDALDALSVGITRCKVSWVLDADIRGFFDAIDHEWLVKFIEHRIADRRVIRHIKKWLRAGVLEDGKRLRPEEGRPETFDFLGFTHACSRTRKGTFALLRFPMKRRMRAKLKAIKQSLWRRMHRPVAETGRWLQSVVRGWLQYYALPRTSRWLSSFRWQVIWLWWRTLRRRGDKRKSNWPQVYRLAARWLPLPRILHPYPEQRLAVRTQGRSPVR